MGSRDHWRILEFLEELSDFDDDHYTEDGLSWLEWQDCLEERATNPDREEPLIEDQELDPASEAILNELDALEPVPPRRLQLLIDHFKCIICYEMFIMAVSLRCGHVFCLECIKKWKKERNNCPICRNPMGSLKRKIKIDTITDTLSSKQEIQLQNERRALIRDRLSPKSVIVGIPSRAATVNQASIRRASTSIGPTVNQALIRRPSTRRASTIIASTVSQTSTRRASTIIASTVSQTSTRRASTSKAATVNQASTSKAATVNQASTSKAATVNHASNSKASTSKPPTNKHSTRKRVEKRHGSKIYLKRCGKKQRSAEAKTTPEAESQPSYGCMFCGSAEHLSSYCPKKCYED